MRLRTPGDYSIRLLMTLTSCCVYSVVLKVGMVGDSQIGKTSLMVKYVEGTFDEDYIQTLGTTDRLQRIQ